MAGIWRVAATAAVLVGTLVVTGAGPASAASGISILTDRVDCGWDPATRTMWPAVRVVRTAAAPDSRVSGRIILKPGIAADRPLGAGRVLANGAMNQNGFVDGPLATTKVAPLTLGVPAWIRPWGARFGDGSSAGGPALSAGANYQFQVSLTDFNTFETVTKDITCRSAGAFPLNFSTFSTTNFAAGKTRVPLSGLVSNLDTAPLPSQWAKLTKPCSPAVAGSATTVTKSFCWADDDFKSTTWYPQGLAGSFESGANGDGAWSGVPAGKSILLVSWYQRQSNAASAPTRLAVIDASVSPARYLFVTLYVPCIGPGCFTPLLGSHVGGLAWAGKYLYVADTNSGFRVFDLSQFYMDTGPKYSLPQVAQYKQPTACSAAVNASVRPCTLDFSYVSVANGSPYRLVSGEFNETNDYARVVSWPLQASGLIDTSAAGRNKQKNELVTGSDLVKFQGVAANGATTVLSASFGSGNPGKRHRIKTQSPYATGGPGMGANSVGAPTGIEDLAGSKASNALWAIAEFPGKRWIWSTSYNANFG